MFIHDELLTKVSNLSLTAEFLNNKTTIYIEGKENGELDFKTLKIIQTHIYDNIDQDNQKRISQVEKQPDLNRFYVLGLSERCWDWEVDGGQDHHTGDVHCDYQLMLGVTSQIVGGLVQNVHKNSWQVGHHEDAKKITIKVNLYT